MTDAPDQSKDSVPERSEWGRLNAGQRYGILCVDVDRALSRADLGKYEQVLMQYVRERSWGTATTRKGGRGNAWPDPIEVRWRLNEIAEETGLPETRLCEARGSLLKARILIEERGCIRINKNADEWVWPAKDATRGRQAQPEFPRLDDAAMRYALAGRSRRGNESVSESVTEDRNASTAEHSGKPEENYGGAEEKLRSAGRKITAERNSPYKERTRNTDSRFKENTETSSGTDDDENSQSSQKAEFEPSHLLPGNTLADVHKVEAWVAKLPKGVGLQQGIDYKIGQWAQVYPIGWIHEALRDAYAHDARKMATYVHRTLRDWKDAGGPDEAREKHQKAKAKPTGAALPLNVYVPPPGPYIPYVPTFQVDALKAKNPGMTDREAVAIIQAEYRSRAIA